MSLLLRACIESGQVDPVQVEAHRAAGEIAPRPSPSAAQPPSMRELMARIGRAIEALDYAAWEHGFRSTPGSQGDTAYAQDLGRKRQACRAELEGLLRDAIERSPGSAAIPAGAVEVH